jgi:hypothetical protein
MNGKELRDGGGATIELGGKKYSLVLDLNALCDIEERYGSVDKGLETMARGTMRDTRFVLWVLMRHENDEITEREAGKLLSTQNMATVIEGITAAFSAGMPEAEPGGDEKNG